MLDQGSGNNRQVYLEEISLSLVLEDAEEFS
jgi:hypothetical protein